MLLCCVLDTRFTNETAGADTMMASQQTSMKSSSNAGSLLAHRLRRWANIKPALVQRPVLQQFKWVKITLIRLI